MPAPVAPIELIDKAEDAGLHYLDDDTPGISRIRRGKAFSYQRPNGEPVDEETRERIKGLSIPPAWREVWISEDPRSHILATGIDNAERKQYIYHPVWEDLRDEIKFDRMSDLGSRLVRLRKSVDRDLRQPGLPRSRVVGLAVAILDRTLIRVGNRKYTRENDSYGLTTLTPEHVAVVGNQIHFEFTGKGGSDYELALHDRRLASLVAKCQDLGGQTLFSYDNGAGPASISSTDINDYIAISTRSHFTAKDFRTWGASATVLGCLARCKAGPDDGAVIQAIDVAAERLGNTRAVCRSSYVHPLVVDTYREGILGDIWNASRNGRWLDREESSLRRVLSAGP
ncbi:MAG TPA: DNA topoisomerase IB [Acidimicrobiia bacterium]